MRLQFPFEKVKQFAVSWENKPSNWENHKVQLKMKNTKDTQQKGLSKEKVKAQALCVQYKGKHKIIHYQLRDKKDKKWKKTFLYQKLFNIKTST